MNTLTNLYSLAATAGVQLRRGASGAAARAVCLSIGVILSVSLTLPEPLYGQSVQRLFSTPAARAELDRLRYQRARGIVDEQPPVSEESLELPVIVDEEQDIIYALGGTLRKADGSYTVWINDTAYDRASLPAHMEMLEPYSQGQLLIHDSQSGASFRLKPGQVLNLSTGQLYESYQYQQIVAAAEAARIAENSTAETGSVILDREPVEAVIEAAQDL